MSVIFGIKEGNKILIAGDKRGSSNDGSFLTDSLNKVITINEHLAFVAAGNVAIETAIRMDVEKIGSRDNISTDDLIDLIKTFYQIANENGSRVILNMPFSFLIAGKSRNNEANLISGCNSNGNLDIKKVPMALYSPADVSLKQCCGIFARNYKFHHSEFAERTIREISERSHLVSTTGDKWIWDGLTGKGLLYSY